jgi:hypothetical protein
VEFRSALPDDLRQVIQGLKREAAAG